MSGLISESQTGNRQLNRHEPTGVYLPVNNEEAYHALLIVTLALVAVLLQALGDIGLGQTNCGFLTIEQCRATLTGRSSFCVPNQFYKIAPVTDKRDERYARTRCPTILIRGAPFYRTPVTKARGPSAWSGCATVLLGCLRANPCALAWRHWPRLPVPS